MSKPFTEPVRLQKIQEDEIYKCFGFGGNMDKKEGKTINAKLREIIRKELDLEEGE